MEKLPSYFNDLWDFLVTPLLQFLILLMLAYYFLDKAAFKEQTKNILQKWPEKIRWLKWKILSPLGISAAASLTILIVLITFMVVLFRINNTIGNFIPGNFSIHEEGAMVNFSSQNTLARIWATRSDLNNVNELHGYIWSTVYKEAPSYPEIHSMLQYADDKIGTAAAWRTFEKTLIVYVILIIPLLLKKCRLTMKRPVRKAFNVLIVITVLLTINYYNTYTAVKLQTDERVIAADMILSKEYKKTSDDSLRIYQSKIDDYRMRTNKEWIVRPVFDFHIGF